VDTVAKPPTSLKVRVKALQDVCNKKCEDHCKEKEEDRKGEVRIMRMRSYFKNMRMVGTVGLEYYIP